jgi:hypothetical protein
MAVAYSEMPFRDLHEGNEENHEKISSDIRFQDRYSNKSPFKYKLPLEPFCTIEGSIIIH